jgi:hypothetical protein
MRECGLQVPERLPTGAILGLATLANVVRAEDVVGSQKFWVAAGCWCFVLENVQSIKPVPARGALGLFRYRGDIV